MTLMFLNPLLNRTFAAPAGVVITTQQQQVNV
jgi:hypothetical protein